MIRVQQPGYSDIRFFTTSDLESKTVYTFANDTKELIVTQDNDRLNSTDTLVSGDAARRTYDDFGRETGYLFGNVNRVTSYLNVDQNRTTNLPQSIGYSFNNTALLNSSYTYDAYGNISSVTENGTTYMYTYDALNQLIAASDGTNTSTYAYDGAGNITSKTVNGVTYIYTYGNASWADLLTNYNGDGITYDAIGNPLTYRDGMSFTWTGRQMNSAVVNSTATYYTYDVDGIRTKKVVGGVTTDYFVNGSTILAEKTGNNVIWYIYDSSNEILGFTYNDTPYYYIKNLQGDVVSVIDANGTIVASYTYEPWGKVVSATGTMASINPIRYRGYYYDNETGLYYLNSRYYDPEIGRFVNADDTAYLGANGTIPSFNLFAYCENNPVNGYDPSGKLILTCIIVGAIVGAVAGGVYGHYQAKKAGYSIEDGWKYLKYVLGYGAGGAAAGALIGWGVGAAATAIGATLTAGSSGTLGTVMYANWQQAEQAVRNAYKAVKYTFTIPGMSSRIVDGFNKSKGIIYEVKYGCASLSQFVQSEIARDVWLRANNAAVKTIEWHFYRSQATGLGGPSAPLLKALLDAGIKVVFH